MPMGKPFWSWPQGSTSAGTLDDDVRPESIRQVGTPMRRYMQAIDGFVLASRGEGWGRVAIDEAQAFPAFLEKLIDDVLVHGVHGEVYRLRRGLLVHVPTARDQCVGDGKYVMTQFVPHPETEERGIGECPQLECRVSLNVMGNPEGSLACRGRELFVPIVTEVVPAQAFTEAEGYHQEYFERNPGQPYCQFVVAPKVAKVRKAYEQNDAVTDLSSQIRKSKALDWLLHNATYVDQNGATLDSEKVLGHSEADHDHGHHHQEESE